MEVIGKYNNICKGAIVMMCGQNIGQDRTKLASAGLWMMSKSINLMSQTYVTKKFVEMSLKNKNLDVKMIFDLVGSGFYFKRGQ
jgi:hypothetical protein